MPTATATQFVVTGLKGKKKIYLGLERGKPDWFLGPHTESVLKFPDKKAAEASLELVSPQLGKNGYTGSIEPYKG